MKKRRVDGVDLSHYQDNLQINWTVAKHFGVKFMYHKATQGTAWTDSAYPARREQAAKAGVPFGAYHFANPKVGRADAVAQAKHFLNYASPKPGDLLPVLDLEDHGSLSVDQLTDWVFTWFDTVFDALGHRGGVLYTRFNLAKVPKTVWLWTARYSDSNANPIVAKPFKHWHIHQFSDGAFGVPSHVNGVGNVDIDTLRKSRYLKGLVLPEPAKRKPAKRKPAKRKPDPIARLLRTARGQIGYHEGRSRGHWNNNQKYSGQVPGLGWSNRQPWCATFVSWCVTKAGLAEFYPRTASTDAGAKWFKDKNQWSEYPAVGAQVFYGVGNDMNHTGIVDHYDNTYVYTTEGNTNTNGSIEGDGVYAKKRVRRADYVRGYGYPKIPGVRLKSADPNY